MGKMTATEAKQNFGELLHKAQQEPVEITRNGRRVGVLVSDEWYAFQTWKEEREYERKLALSRKQIERSETIPAEQVFAEMRENIKKWAKEGESES